MFEQDESRLPFPRMLAIFFAVFHPQAGPSVIHQVPANFVGSFSNGSISEHPYCVNMDSISEYVIPKKQLCDHAISICNSGYRIIGYPVRVEGPQYERNAFIFNCCVVFDESDDVSAYMPVVRRLARVLKSMEELKKSLSSEHERPLVHGVIEQVLQDLNSHGECRIPVIDDEVTLNIKLFPQYTRPLQVQEWHVPVPLIALYNVVDTNWDLTMQRVIPYINGVSSIKQISRMADVDPSLVAKCIEHLVYYNCMLTTDIFQFNAMYAVTPELDHLNFDPVAQNECCTYVSSSAAAEKPNWALIFGLYSSLSKEVLILRDWIRKHVGGLHDVDVRRFVSFGVIRGFVRRVHTYPYLSQDNRRTALGTLADGTRHLDEICTVQGRSQSDVLSDLRQQGRVHLIHR